MRFSQKDTEEQIHIDVHALLVKVQNLYDQLRERPSDLKQINLELAQEILRLAHEVERLSNQQNQMDGILEELHARQEAIAKAKPEKKLKSMLAKLLFFLAAVLITFAPGLISLGFFISMGIGLVVLAVVVFLVALLIETFS